MPSKKKKFNARFPPARIKKIMQTDEDVGKVAAAVPVIISRALELFIESFIQRTATITKDRNAKTLSATHIKQTIHSEKTFDFLRDLVANVPDHQPEEDGDSNPPFPSCSTTQEVKKPRVQRPRKEKTGARRGRPRKKDVVKQEDVEEDKEETESEDEDEEGSDSDSSPTNTEQLETSADHSTDQSTAMQTSVLSNSTETDTATTSVCQMSSPFGSPCLPQQNPLSPRLPMLQSPPQFPNVPMMPHPPFQNLPHPQLQSIPMPQLQNIPVPQLRNMPMHNMPHPQLQNVANHMVPPHSGLTNQFPPPPPLTGFSNQFPIPPNFYPPHAPQMAPYPTLGSKETFHSDQNFYSSSRETTQFNPHSNRETVNPGNSLYMNNIQNNEPLDMSKSSQNKRSPSPSQEPVPKTTKQTALMAGLPNIMNMTAPKQTTNDDDDYDT